VEAGQLQLGDRRDDPRSRHDAVDEMIGELGSDRLMREPIGFTLFASSFPVTSQIALWQAMNTTPRLCSAGIVLPAGPNTLLGFLEVGKLRRRGLANDERVRLEVASCHLGEPVFVRNIPGEKRQVSGAVRGRTVRKSRCPKENTCALSELRMRFIQRLPMSVLSQICFRVSRQAITSFSAVSSHRSG
jgi:hypothetical protein